LTVNILTLLFGSILTVTWEDILLFSVLVTAVLGVVVGLYKEYLYLTFDEETARASGLPTHGLNILFTILPAVAVVTSIKIVGILLVSALLVVPAAASHYVSQSFRQALTFSVVFALLSVVLGIFTAFLFNWPPGGAVVAVSLSLFTIVALGRHVWTWVAAAPD
jgi:zinc transport system permease protein